MIHPGKRHCDLCQNEIPAKVLFCTLTYPLSPDDHKRMMATSSLHQAPFEIIGLRQIELRASVYQFDICTGCIDGVLPMLDDMKTEYIKRMIAERDARNTISAPPEDFR